MANIEITSTANSILVDFKDLWEFTPHKIQKGIWTSGNVFFGKYTNYVEVIEGNNAAWAVSFDGHLGTFQIDKVNGTTPTDNEHLYTLLAACKG